ncbi:MAG: YcxB family protein [Clostridiales bacterium]|nr:YcxB family protein [Clostridiales bacterium]
MSDAKIDSADDAFDLRFIMTLEDYQNYNFLIIRKNLRFIQFFINYALMGIFLRSIKPYFEVDLLLCIFLLAISFAVIVLPIAIKRRSFGSRYSDSGTDTQVWMYSISESAVSSKTSDGESRIPWSKMFSFSEDKEGFLARITEAESFYFPKRCFKNSEQEAKMRKYGKTTPRIKDKGPLACMKNALACLAVVVMFLLMLASVFALVQG